MRIYLSSMAVTLPTAALNATHAYPSTIFQRLWCFCAVVRNYSSQRIWMNSVCYFSYSLTVDDNVRRQIGIESSVWRKKKYGLNRRSDPFIMSTSDVFWISYSRCRLFFFCRQDCVLMWLYTLPNTRQQLNEDFAEHSYFNYVLGHALYFFFFFSLPLLAQIFALLLWNVLHLALYDFKASGDAFPYIRRLRLMTYRHRHIVHTHTRTLFHYSLSFVVRLDCFLFFYCFVRFCEVSNSMHDLNFLRQYTYLYMHDSIRWPVIGNTLHTWSGS